jgi:hypothetical protein
MMRCPGIAVKERVLPRMGRNHLWGQLVMRAQSGKVAGAPGSVVRFEAAGAFRIDFSDHPGHFRLIEQPADTTSGLLS